MTLFWHNIQTHKFLPYVWIMKIQINFSHFDSLKVLFPHHGSGWNQLTYLWGWSWELNPNIDLLWIVRLPSDMKIEGLIIKLEGVGPQQLRPGMMGPVWGRGWTFHSYDWVVWLRISIGDISQVGKRGMFLCMGNYFWMPSVNKAPLIIYKQKHLLWKHFISTKRNLYL